ncbi:P27 family phage terminase small subunit [Bradyrhizobium sp. Cp5.3]|uniref:P27 family phage terminase small subunit n=1 Tax=Bradyrhizobium sp. Cp5.3 TaxID=443598 RepID=UPI00040A925C|nr:P27 family phage terminase small subunit [Bradyrhizobium sp. Cp5.3]
MAAEKPIPLVTYRPGITPEPPPQLDVIASELWRSILAEWDVPDRAGRALLEQACAAYGMAERLRRQIAVDGDMIETGNGVGMKLNPMIMAEIAARGLCARLLRRLGVLDTEPKRGPGRPPKPGGW